MSSGLLATGKHGTSVVSIEELDTDPASFSVWIEMPSLNLQFDLPGLARLKALAEFLRTERTNDRWLEFENCLGGTLAFVIHDGALWIRVNTENGQMFRASPSASDAESLRYALDDAMRDLA